MHSWFDQIRLANQPDFEIFTHNPLTEHRGTIRIRPNHLLAATLPLLQARGRLCSPYICPNQLLNLSSGLTQMQYIIELQIVDQATIAKINFFQKGHSN